MNPDSKALIDTNILVYAIDKDSEKHEISKEIVKKYCETKNSVLSAQNLAEFVFVVTEKKKSLTMEQANQFVFDLMDNSTVLFYGGNEVIRANQIKHSYKIPFFDSLLVATIEKAKIFSIITANYKDFEKVEWLEVKNPFI